MAVKNEMQLDALGRDHAPKQLLGVIGDPIEHSLSPQLHNAIIELHQLALIYFPFRIPADRLVAFLHKARESPVLGFNVTLPHKQTILPLLDEVDPIATRIGAVNTVKNVNGRLVGCNTDAEAARKCVDHAHISLTDCSVMMLGAGGAARAVIFHLLPTIRHLTLVNRSAARLTRFLADLSSMSDRLPIITSLPFNDRSAIDRALEATDLLINTTPVGMMPHVDNSPLPALSGPGNLTVFDVIYTPEYTRLIADAQSHGLKIITGVEMFLEQAALAFEWWTQRSVDREFLHKCYAKL